MPYLRELVKLHSDDPFALVGINCFDDEATYRKGLADFEVSWISAYQGAEGTEINDLYRIDGYPTYLLLDADGKIIRKGHSAKAFGGDIARLLGEMKKAK